MKPIIEEIRAEETLSIRHKVMWPHRSIDYVRLPNDTQGKHFGLFIEAKMVSVISLFIENNKAQFRKFATLHQYQGKGFGTILLKEIMRMVIYYNLNSVWCNARIDKSNYYAKFGMSLTDTKFFKGGIEYVVMERKFHD